MDPKERPRLHGHDHRPVGYYGPSDKGGPDPILPSLGFTRRAVSLDVAYFDPGNLEAWWRLGEAGPFPTGAPSIADFCADSSGNSRNLTAVNSQDGSTYITSGSNARIPTMDEAGALDFGDPSINDGAILFHWNAAAPGGTDHAIRVRLEAGGDDSFGEQSFGSLLSGGWHQLDVGEGFTLACWMKFLAVGTSPGVDDTSSGFLPIASTVKHVFGGSTTGWRLGWICDTGQVQFDTYSASHAGYGYLSSVNPAPGEWFLFTMTLERTGSSSYTRTVYLNSAVDDTVTGTASAVGIGDGGNGISLGGGNSPITDSVRMQSRGGLDEFAIFSRALTADEVGNLYSVTVAEGDTWTTTGIRPEDLDTTGAAEGMVPVYNSTTGKFEYRYPVQIEY